jgi:hypothetical protein
LLATFAGAVRGAGDVRLDSIAGGRLAAAVAVADTCAAQRDRDDTERDQRQACAHRTHLDPLPCELSAGPVREEQEHEGPEHGNTDPHSDED